MEIQILHWFESLHNPITDPLFYGITMLGEAGIFWILLALMFFCVPAFKKDRKIGLTIAFALILSLIMCNGLMKNIIQRPRAFWAPGASPTNIILSGEFENLFHIFDSIDDWSFPSGHTSASFAAAIAIYMWKKKKAIPFVVIAALISLSRLYLTVHYPTDVLVSLILGSLYGVIGYFITKWLCSKYSKCNEVFCQGAPYKDLFKKN